MKSFLDDIELIRGDEGGYHLPSSGPESTSPAGGGPHVNCECFWGNPIIREDGTCTCPSGDAIPAGTGGVKTAKNMKWTPNGWVPKYPVKVAEPTGTAGETKIFGLSPLVVLGGALAGLWILSSMDGGK